MRVDFRQGVVSYQTDGFGAPTYLVESSTPDYVDFQVNPKPTVVTFAHGTSDYLVVFDEDAAGAWGPLATGTTTWLYWDIDLLTGAVSRGMTVFEPVASFTAPSTPMTDQHWFDLAATTMKIWNGSKWINRVRVFAGYVPSGSASNVAARTTGSQAGLNTPVNAGFVMLDALLRPLRTSAGELLTTETRVRVKNTANTSGVLAVPPNAFIPVRALENLPAMAIVTFTDEDAVMLASGDPSLPVARTPVGIVQESLGVNEVGTLTQYGEITYDQWDWTGNFGKPLYCDYDGQLTTTRPNGLVSYRVGVVKNANTILFQVDSETQPAIYEVEAADIVIDGQAPVIVPPMSVNGLGERVWTITMPAATTTTAGHMTAAQALAIEAATQAAADATTAVASKADTAHLHLIEDVTGLQDALDDKADTAHDHDAAYAPVGHDHDAAYAPVVHVHVVDDVTGLQAALDGKAARVHLNSFDEVVQTVDRTGASDLGSGDTLSMALASKADALHGHTIANITGLQDALDGKAAASHDHAGIYAPVIHTHLYADITDAPVLATVATTGAYGDLTGTPTPIVSGAPTAIGDPGDTAGSLRFDAGNLYVCVANYDGVSAIWLKAVLAAI